MAPPPQPVPQGWPCLALHVPLPSQLPGQLSVSSALVTATQVPPPPVQAWQVPQLAAPQQWPSTQLPVAQSLAAPQVLPLRLLQVPVASQVLAPLH
jgi:hypothetical protein